MGLFAGVDAGSVGVKALLIDATGRIAYEAPYLRHFGHVEDALTRSLAALEGARGNTEITSWMFTGVHGPRLAGIFGLPFEVETITQLTGVLHLVPQTRTVISLGGQDAALFQVEHQDGTWRVKSFTLNGPCAAGTGSFIDQQAERLACAMYGASETRGQREIEKTLADFIALGSTSTRPARVACRCTVFTKSDMIHLQNKGESLADIIAGLHEGNAANFISTLVAGRSLESPVVFIGGVAGNRLQVEAFRRHFPDLIVPEHHAYVAALGAALEAQRRSLVNRLELRRLRESPPAVDALPRAEALTLRWTHFADTPPLPPLPARTSPPIPAVLGIDIGSTTTKYALIGAQGELLAKRYVPTRGKPLEVTQELVAGLAAQAGSGVSVQGIATTGSGRHVVGEYIGADLVLDEITAHTIGAVAFDPGVDTIFEIGGQDSKYIRIDKTHPLDFDMNKVCAAGTGSFLHELANKFGIDIVGDFQRIALSSRRPLELAERCTVFMESDALSASHQGVPQEDLVAGLCYAVVRNYLNRVVGKRSIGKRVMFLGGPSLNQGVVAAFERVLDRPVLLPPHREVMGAWGAARSVLASWKRGELRPVARDLESLARTPLAFTESICHGFDGCHNQCKLKVYDFGGRRNVWGGDCGRFETKRGTANGQEDLFAERRLLFQEALAGPRIASDSGVDHLEPGRPVIGIPSGLHALEWAIFAAHFFSGIGLNVRLSGPSTAATVRAGLEAMTAETCFPVKVFHGHARLLFDQVDLLFLPTVVTMPTPSEKETGFFCPLVANSGMMVKAALNLPPQKLIQPCLFLKEGPDAVALCLRDALPESLRPSRGMAIQAARTAWNRQDEFRAALVERGHRFLEQTPADTPLWIVSGRPYNLYDERLNLRLGQLLAGLGIRAMPFDFLDLEDVPLDDFPGMYWGFGARVLRCGRKVASRDNWFGLHLTNFSCGADSFMEHFLRHVLGDKPLLILELDEHSAEAGLLTRIEAFQKVIEGLRPRPAASSLAPRAVSKSPDPPRPREVP